MQPTTKFTKILSFLALLIATSNQKGVEFWKKKAIYQVVTDRFYNSSTPPCPNWKSTYCGGNWNGIIEKLDYISGMGFTGIWVSPVQENMPNAYHGYAIVNIFKLNPHFGNPTIFKNLSSEAKKFNISIMVDVVPNHMAGIMFDYSKLTPFNKSEYFHDYCYIYNDDKLTAPWRTTNCRLLNLPDLKHEHPFVRNTLTKWAADFVANYSVEGLRLDALPHMPHFFLKAFNDAVNTKKQGVANGSETYIIGECFAPHYEYVASYQHDIDAVFNFPMYFAASEIFKSGNHTASKFRNLWSKLFTYFDDVHALGLFLDNHDTMRFLYGLERDQYYRLGNALSFIFFAPGIPIVIYGTEQEYNMNNDPLNRFPLWLWKGPDTPVHADGYFGGEDGLQQKKKYNPYDTNSLYYQYIKRLNHYRGSLDIFTDDRKMVQHLTVLSSDDNVGNDENFYSFQRAEAVLALPTANFKYDKAYSVTLGGVTGFKVNDVLVDIHDTSYKATITKPGQVTVKINQGRGRVLVPEKYIQKIE